MRNGWKQALIAIAFATPVSLPLAAQAQQQQRPNIVVIWGDDIGLSDISAYSHGLMGFKTPNIDRIANEGVMFTDYYGEQSCTAGRASFITGQSDLMTFRDYPQRQKAATFNMEEVLAKLREAK